MPLVTAAAAVPGHADMLSIHLPAGQYLLGEEDGFGLLTAQSVLSVQTQQYLPADKFGLDSENGTATRQLFPGCQDDDAAEDASSGPRVKRKAVTQEDLPAMSTPVGSVKKTKTRHVSQAGGDPGQAVAGSLGNATSTDVKRIKHNGKFIVHHIIIIFT